MSELSPDAIAVIQSPRGKLLPVTSDDRLWLLRAVEAEGRPYDMVAQTLVNRWAFLADTMPQQYPRLAELVRAYAQPVNPRWFPSGDKHLAALEKGQDSRERAAKRLNEHATRTDFAGHTELAVQRALYGPVTLPVGAMHYSVPRTSAAWLRLLLVPGEPGTSNAIYTADSRAAQRALYAIPGQPRRASGRAGMGKLGVLALLAGVGIGGVLLWRSANKKGAAATAPVTQPLPMIEVVQPTIQPQNRKRGLP